MHELGIALEVIALCERASNGARVKRVTLDIGKLAAIMPDALRFSFQVASEGTLLEGAVLELSEVPARGRCQVCKREADRSGFFDVCECGGGTFDWLTGEELRVREMEVM
jgi:hydrogenase nickel incorporation protein HypA/HybF